MSESNGLPVWKMRCSGCSYDLRGLPENRCPECGRPFDPDDPNTYVTKLRSGRRYLATALAGVVAMAIPQIVAYLSDLGYVRLSQLPDAVEVGLALFLVFLLLGGFVIEVHVLGVSFRLLRNKPGAVQHRQAMRAAFVLSLVFVLGPVVFLAGSLAASFLF
jgi:hypothetical protein